MLAILVDPALMFTLIPLGFVLLGVFSFELAMAVTISTLPRSRFQQKWTPREMKRVVRVFVVIFGIWPLATGLVLAHFYLPLWVAVTLDVGAATGAYYAVRWLRQGVREKHLILAGHCVNCFYDLRASDEQQHCPECGTELHDHPLRIKPPARKHPRRASA